MDKEKIKKHLGNGNWKPTEEELKQPKYHLIVKDGKLLEVKEDIGGAEATLNLAENSLVMTEAVSPVGIGDFCYPINESLGHNYQYANSCVAHALSKIMSSINYRQTGRMEDFCTQWIYGNRASMSWTGSGMSFSEATARLVRDGVPLMSEIDCNWDVLIPDNEYDVAIPTVKSVYNDVISIAKTHRPLKYVSLSATVDNVKNTLLNVGPVFMGIYISDVEWASWYSGASYVLDKHHTAGNTLDYLGNPVTLNSGTHGVLIKGWRGDVAGKGECFIIHNSWGEAGDDGDFYIPTSIFPSTVYSALYAIYPLDFNNVVDVDYYYLPTVNAPTIPISDSVVDIWNNLMYVINSKRSRAGLSSISIGSTGIIMAGDNITGSQFNTLVNAFREYEYAIYGNNLSVNSVPTLVDGSIIMTTYIQTLFDAVKNDGCSLPWMPYMVGPQPEVISSTDLTEYDMYLFRQWFPLTSDLLNKKILSVQSLYDESAFQRYEYSLSTSIGDMYPNNNIEWDWVTHQIGYTVQGYKSFGNTVQTRQNRFASLIRHVKDSATSMALNIVDVRLDGFTDDIDQEIFYGKNLSTDVYTSAEMNTLLYDSLPPTLCAIPGKNRICYFAGTKNTTLYNIGLYSFDYSEVFNPHDPVTGVPKLLWNEPGLTANYMHLSDFGTLPSGEIYFTAVNENPNTASTNNRVHGFLLIYDPDTDTIIKTIKTPLLPYVANRKALTFKRITGSKFVFIANDGITLVLDYNGTGLTILQNTTLRFRDTQVYTDDVVPFNNFKLTQENELILCYADGFVAGTTSSLGGQYYHAMTLSWDGTKLVTVDDVPIGKVYSTATSLKPVYIDRLYDKNVIHGMIKGDTYKYTKIYKVL